MHFYLGYVFLIFKSDFSWSCWKGQSFAESTAVRLFLQYCYITSPLHYLHWNWFVLDIRRTAVYILLILNWFWFQWISSFLIWYSLFILTRFPLFCNWQCTTTVYLLFLSYSFTFWKSIGYYVEEHIISSHHWGSVGSRQVVASQIFTHKWEDLFHLTCMHPEVVMVMTFIQLFHQVV